MRDGTPDSCHRASPDRYPVSFTAASSFETLVKKLRLSRRKVRYLAKPQRPARCVVRAQEPPLDRSADEAELFMYYDSATRRWSQSEQRRSLLPQYHSL